MRQLNYGEDEEDPNGQEERKQALSIAAKVKKLKDKLFEDEFEQVFKIEGAPSSRGEVIKI